MFNLPPFPTHQRYNNTVMLGENVAFKKTSVSITPAREIPPEGLDLESMVGTTLRAIDSEKDLMVWDGEKWVLIIDENREPIAEEKP